MTAPLFLGEVADAVAGGTIQVGGDEAHHAVAVRRIRAGETVLVADGRGRAIRGTVERADKAGLTVHVEELLAEPERRHRWIAVQALAKGDRAELAVEAMTELGVDQVVPWNAARSEVRWAADRADKALARWRSKVREAAKQSRRFTVPAVTEPASTAAVRDLVGRAALTLVLHESATGWLRDIDLPESGDVAFVIGPEGGITDAELEAFVAAGARIVRIADAVLRTSTAGVVALAQAQALVPRRG